MSRDFFVAALAVRQSVRRRDDLTGKRFKVSNMVVNDIVDDVPIQGSITMHGDVSKSNCFLHPGRGFS